MSPGVLRTLLVDDEQPARERLARLLGELEGVEVVGQAESGEEALERVLELQPDLLLLDIQMPGASGLEVAASLPSPRPAIVFCTAFDEYAVEAFELAALDYLLKPVSRARLAQAIERASRKALAEREAALDGVSGPVKPHPSRLLARRGPRYHVVPAAEVLYLISEGGLTKLETGREHYWMHPALADLARRLDPARFFRISRAAIVNLDAVREVTPGSGGHGELLLRDGTRLQVSRRRLRELMNRLGSG
jgi:two-component system LytT family response regulator